VYTLDDRKWYYEVDKKKRGAKPLSHNQIKGDKIKGDKARMICPCLQQCFR
jgi:hypothetical protein